MDVDAMLGRLSLEDKVRLLTGADSWSLHPLPQIGLRRLVMSDGPVGVRGEAWDGANPSANLPSSTAQAATWDPALVRRLGELLAAEAESKGVDVLLAPTVNLHRSPLGGRHFECFSEDPLLTGRIGRAFVEGLQDAGVAAAVKHFVANDSETERMTYDARIDPRALREVWLAPFEAIVADGGACAVMAAYNRVDGHTMTESPLLDEVLKGEWGFDGVVVSDWTATRSTVESANAALDLAMPGPDGPWGEALLEAVADGRVGEDRIDEKVRRLLRLAFRVGALDADGEEGRLTGRPAEFPPDRVSTVLRDAAAAGFVLAHNEDAVLPLDPAGIRKVAVLGPNAEPGRTQGGGSATVFPQYKVSPLDGLRAALGSEVEVVHAVGATATTYLPPVEGEVTVRFLNADDGELGIETKRDARMLYLGSFGADIAADKVAAIEATVRLTAVASGEHRIGVAGVGRFTVDVKPVESDGSHGEGAPAVRVEPLIDTELPLPDPSEPFLAVVKPPQQTAALELAAGQTVDVTVRQPVSVPFVATTLGHAEPAREEADELAHAVALAGDADVAIVVVGTTSEVESEGFDRDTLALPGRQDDLVAEVAKVCDRTVVVVNSGAPVELPWADDVSAVLLSWFGGQEYGNALADVLLGVAEPGGRLPTTWPAKAEDCPVLSTRPVDGVVEYSESIHVGYRGWQRARLEWSGPEPRYPFGHGLGYTDWEYGDPTLTGVLGRDLAIHVPVRNTGVRPGRTVVQAYASRPDSAVERPLSWLVGFASVEAEPGESTEAVIEVERRALEYFEVDQASADRADGVVATGRWRLEPGAFEIAIGESSAEIVAHTIIEAPPED